MPSELIPHHGGELARAEQPTPMQMIAAIARDPSIPIDRITALIQLQERMEAREAEKEFNRDFAAAMIEMPRVEKLGIKDMREKGSIPYAKYEHVDAAVRPVESKHGFARTFSTRMVDGKAGLMMTLRLTHRAGHCITSERYCPPDPGPGRNEIQAQGSGESYGRRYLTLAVWNIVTVGADDDANSADPISDEQALKIRDLLDYLQLTPPNLERFWRMAEAQTVEGIQRRKFDEVYAALKKSYDARQKGGKP